HGGPVGQRQRLAHVRAVDRLIDERHRRAMMQLWLRCLLVDSKSRKLVGRWDDHPLPPQLEVRHLRSYLEQRFGPPISHGPDTLTDAGPGLRLALPAAPMLRIDFGHGLTDGATAVFVGLSSVF